MKPPRLAGVRAAAVLPTAPSLLGRAGPRVRLPVGGRSYAREPRPVRSPVGTPVLTHCGKLGRATPHVKMTASAFTTTVLVNVALDSPGAAVNREVRVFSHDFC